MTYDKVFVDSDIFLDLFLKRTPFFIYSRSLLSEEVTAQMELCTSTLIIANIHYLTSKNVNKSVALAAVRFLINTISVFSFDAGHINTTVEGQPIDFEDSIQYYIAKQNHCDLIISRNIKHYNQFDIPVLTAEYFLRNLL